MALSPRILTFNFHEPYLCLMAKAVPRLFVGVYENSPLSREWQTQFRPIPKNLVFLSEAVWRHDMAAGKFDVVIAHNESNAIDLMNAPCGRLLVAHNRRTFLEKAVRVDDGKGDPVERFAILLNRLRERFTFIFISESKRDDYRLPGRVIRPGIDVNEYGGYTGETGKALRVGNVMRERDYMFDVDFQEAVCQGLPNRVVGDNPTIPGSKPAASFDELLSLYRTHRCLLHVTREAFEDGYNLSMLEAMACGMPVVSLANATSPLTNGWDGFISYDAGVLRQGIQALLDDPGLAKTLGEHARNTVAERFPMEAFIAKWREAIEDAARFSTRRTGRPSAGKAPEPVTTPESPESTPAKRNLLLYYMATPITTGRYFEMAARKEHNVLTTGFRCPEQVLKLWGFSDPIPPYPPQEINLPLTTSFDTIRAGIPETFKPDLLLWIDSGPRELPEGFDAAEIAKACYLIDTHLDIDTRLSLAPHFHVTFLAQKAQVEAFKQTGLKEVYWVPLGCSPELHAAGPFKRIHDIGFVGKVDVEADERRARLMKQVAARFPNHRIEQTWPAEMAQIYAQSKIVVNCCVKNDLNMRVFEAMASGALLITDPAPGLEDLFEDGKHLVIYRNDEDLLPLIERYLHDDDARQRIAAEGRACVLAHHTYAHRLATMLDIIMRGEAISGGGYVGESRYHSGGYYRTTRPEVLPLIPPSILRHLDIGCAAGDFGVELKRKGVREVYGIEMDPRACALARASLDRVVEGNIETMDLPFPDAHFDCITFLDVVEHLVDPAAALRKIERVLAPNGVVLLSVPNVRYFDVVRMLINGNWTYQNAGILDRTHLRFFTAAELPELIESAGLELLLIRPLSMASEESYPRRPDGTVALQNAIIGPLSNAVYHDFLTFQYIVLAGKRGGDRLARARKALEAGRYDEARQVAYDAYVVDERERFRIYGTALARLGKLDEAETVYRNALEQFPGDHTAEANLGMLYVAMNRFGEARALLKSVLSGEPANHRALGGLGLIAISEGKPADAVDYLRKALAANPDNVGIAANLVNAARQCGQLAAIQNDLDKAAEACPGNLELARISQALRDECHSNG